LAFQSDDEITRVAARATPQTAMTISGRDELVAELAKIREVGYAINRGEWRDGVWGIVAPVWSPGSILRGAVGVSGPRVRIEEDADRLVELVLTEAAAMSGTRHRALQASGARVRGSR